MVNSRRSKRCRLDRLTVVTSQPGKQFSGVRHELGPFSLRYSGSRTAKPTECSHSLPPYVLESRDTEARTALALWLQHHLAELLALFEPALCLGRRLEWERAIDDRRQLTGEEELGCLQQLPLRAHVRAEQ